MVKRLSNEIALDAIKKIHGDKYDYSLFNYTRALNKVTLICKKHGPFSMRYSDLKEGSGCKECGRECQREKLTRTFDSYIAEAISTHGDLYDYSFANKHIAGGHTKIEILCKKCGNKFSQRIGRHAAGNGCSKCQDYGFCEAKAGCIYFLESQSMVKVGITNRDPFVRLKEINKHAPEKFRLTSKARLDGQVCTTAESTLHEALGAFLQKQSNVFSGHTEVFVANDPEFARGLFDGYVGTLPAVGELQYTPKPLKQKETDEERRKRLSAKTGLPVGVVRKYDKWYFQIITKENGKKDKKFLGSFEALEACIDFANHYWETGEILPTTLNRMTHNRYGLPNCVTPCPGGYRVQGGIGTRKSQQNFYLGTFKKLEDAISALETKRKELLNG